MYDEGRRGEGAERGKMMRGAWPGRLGAESSETVNGDIIYIFREEGGTGSPSDCATDEQSILRVDSEYRQD